MQIVVLDARAIDPGDLDWAPLKALGILNAYDRTPAELTARRLIGADAVLTRGVHIGAEDLARAKNLKLIINLAGEDGLVDTAAVKARGIRVESTADGVAAAVAQHTMALLFEIANGTAHYDLAVHRGRWTASPDFCLMDQEIVALNGLTMGLVGTGEAAAKTAAACMALGMRVLYCGSTGGDPFPGERVDFEDLIQQADVISLHLAATAETAGLIGTQVLSRVKPGCILLNTAHGSLISEPAVLDALSAGRLRAYGADVARTEPILMSSPLLKAENCLITPRVAWAPRRVRQQMLDLAAQAIQKL